MYHKTQQNYGYLVDLAELTREELQRRGAKVVLSKPADMHSAKIIAAQAEKRGAAELKAARDEWLADKSSPFARIVANRLVVCR